MRAVHSDVRQHLQLAPWLEVVGPIIAINAASATPRVID
jgi:hypothetical protein